MGNLKIKNVEIGDQFIPRGKVRKDVHTVTAFVERKNMITGEIVGYECWCEYQYMGQTMSKEVPFATVVMNRIKKVT